MSLLSLGLTPLSKAAVKYQHYFEEIINIVGAKQTLQYMTLSIVFPDLTGAPSSD